MINTTFGLILIGLGVLLLGGLIFIAENVAGRKFRWRMSEPTEFFAMANSATFILVGAAVLARELFH